MLRAIICRHFEFEAAHKLPNYDGDCSKLHGHTYKLEVELTNTHDQSEYTGTTLALNNNGMVLDFKALDRVVKNVLKRHYDHKYLNNHIHNPTAENIGATLFREISDEIAAKSLEIPELYFVELVAVTLWETSDSRVRIEEVK